MVAGLLAFGTSGLHAQDTLKLSELPWPCMSDSLSWSFRKTLHERNADSVIVFIDGTNGVRSLENATTSILWMEYGEGRMRKFSGCSHVGADTSYSCDAQTAFDFFQENKLYSIYSVLNREKMDHSVCGSSCHCFFITIYTPGEFKVYFVRDCGKEGKNKLSYESNAGIGSDEAGRLLLDWVRILRLL